MARKKGDFNFSANFEVKKKATLDAREFVNNYSELLEYTSDDYLPSGFVVKVKGDDDISKRGMWMLVNENDLSNPLSWINITKGALPFNQVTQIGSFSFNNTTYVAILGATLDWGFNENGVNYVVGSFPVNLTAPHASFPRADIIVWSNGLGYQVVQGTAAADFSIPNTPTGKILVQTIIRNVDGSTSVQTYSSTGFAKLEGSNTFTGAGNRFTKDVGLDHALMGAARFTDLYGGNPLTQLFRIGATNSATKNLIFANQLTFATALEWIGSTNIFDFKNRPTLNGSNLALLSEINTVQADIDAHELRTDNPHAVTKSQVSLANVDNTSDIAKPVSTATQTALNGKQASLTNPITGTGTVNRIPKFTGTSALGNSLISDNGTIVSIGTSITSSLTFKSFGKSYFEMQSEDTDNFILYDVINDNNAIRYAGDGGILYLQERGLNLLIGGNVGIGTTNPNFKLDVNGTGNFTGNLSGTSASFSNTLSVLNQVTAQSATLLSGIGDALTFKFSSVYGKSVICTSWDSLRDIGNDLSFKVNNAAGDAVQALSLRGTGEAIFSSSVTAPLFIAYGGNIGVNAYGNEYGVSANSGNIGISASGGNIGVNATSNNIGVKANGGNIGVYTNGDNTGVSAYGNEYGVNANSGNIGVSANGGNIGVYAYSNTGVGVNAYSDTGTGIIAYSGNGIIAKFSSNTGEKVRITNAGFVGIGTTNPNFKLDVYGTTRIYNASLKLDFTVNVGGIKWSLNPFISGVSNGGFQIYDETNSASRLAISTSGNVGIGTTSPNFKLDVNGTGNFTGNLTGTSANFSSTLQASNIGAGITSNIASYLNTAVNTASVGQLHLPKSAVDYSGTLAGMIWNNAMEFKFYDDVVVGINRLIKLNGNTALANSNPLNVVTSTGPGGNLGTLKAEVSFSRFPTAISYTVLLTDVGFGWIVAVTDTSSTRTITLPVANTVSAGFRLTIKDESGAAGTLGIIVSRQSTDLLDNAATQSVNTNFGFKTFYSNGVDKWFSI